jgi:hypothetical protein
MAMTEPLCRLGREGYCSNETGPARMNEFIQLLRQLIDAESH